MIIAKVAQEGQIITLKDVVPTFKYSANLQMQFVKDERYKECVVTGWYKRLKGDEYLLDIKEDGTFTLRKDVFSKEGSVYFSFALNYPDGKIIHLGTVDFEVKQSFGNDDDAILPEEQETWISVVSRQVSCIWDRDYKPQLEENLNIIDTKTEEIKAAASKVKEDALESSNSAKSALESAGVAQSSANTALEAKEKALEYMASTERFKNSASTYANQANLAKTEAQQSATNASNSASNALSNANKAKEYLDSINTAVNSFNTDYAEKVNSFNQDYNFKVGDFNTNVEDANTALDTKIEQANTDLDKKMEDANTSLDTKISEANNTIDVKVADATVQAEKAKNEADRASLVMNAKLDKNQGAENAGKTMVVDTDGNVVPGNALPSNVYTQEEVDYMLRDKMDKPYSDIEIVENVLLDDCLEGNLKVTKIIGNAVKKNNEINGVTKIHIKCIGKNIFDGKLTTRSGYSIETGAIQGTTLVSINRNTNQFINVHPNKKIISNAVNIIFLFYDINKKYLGYKEGNGVTIPANCYYINFCGNQLPSKLQIEFGETSTGYENHKITEVERTLRNPLYKFNNYDEIDLINLNFAKKIIKYSFRSSDDWIDGGENETHVRFAVRTRNWTLSFGTLEDCNLFPVLTTENRRTEYIYCSGTYVYLNILKTKLTEPTVEALIQFLVDNNGYFFVSETATNYDLSQTEPELTELLKALKIYAPITNIFIGGEVKPIVNAKYSKDLALAQQKLETKLLNLQTEVVKNV